MRKGDTQVARASEWLDALELVPQRGGTPATHAPVRRHQPEAVRAGALREDLSSEPAKLLEEREDVHDGGGAERVVDDDRERGWTVAGASPARHRPRRGESDEQHDQHTEEHEQDVAQTKGAAVLLLGPREVARGWKLDAGTDAPAE